MRPNKPSNTALIVAAGLQLVRPCDAYAHLIPREAQRLSATILRRAYPNMAALLQRPAFVRACRALERATLPGIILHYALRKQRLRQHAALAVASGCTQVVVLGAGLDTLSMELKADYPDLCCIELDHPATQAAKRSGAGSNGAAIHFVSADLAHQTLASALGACNAFDATAPTLFVAEGLLMYLALPQVARLFAQMTEVAPCCHVAFTWFDVQPDGRPNFSQRSRLVDLWLQLRSEPFLSGQSPLQLGAFLGPCGLEVLDVGESADLIGSDVRTRLSDTELPLTGEYICLARTRECDTAPALHLKAQLAPT